MTILKNKKALIVGVASKRSIAYGIAASMHEQGAKLAFTFQNERLESRVRKIAAEFNAEIIEKCDVADDNDISELFAHIKNKWETIDIVVHSVAYAPQDQLQGNFIDSVTREGFQIAHDISSYSLAALAKQAMPLMKDQHGAIMAVTYLGSQRAFPNYNTMGVAKASLEATVKYLAHSMGPHGIRVNAISAGPIKTLAAAGISSFKKMLEFNKKAAPMRENVTIEQVGNASAFICSDMASGITGEILHVDNGFNTVGMSLPEEETE
ncbi:MAG: enoyl-ACP reductase [Legionellales bacterium]|jgi:enoyl-[acyl-carrier protein] reductase I|nr:enoyl-ACP reductase [Legionellales bacterium]